MLCRRTWTSDSERTPSIDGYPRIQASMSRCLSRTSNTMNDLLLMLRLFFCRVETATMRHIILNEATWPASMELLLILHILIVRLLLPMSLSTWDKDKLHKQKLKRRRIHVIGRIDAKHVSRYRYI